MQQGLSLCPKARRADTLAGVPCVAPVGLLLIGLAPYPALTDWAKLNRTPSNGNCGVVGTQSREMEKNYE